MHSALGSLADTGAKLGVLPPAPEQGGRSPDISENIALRGPPALSAQTAALPCGRIRGKHST